MSSCDHAALKRLCDCADRSALVEALSSGARPWRWLRGCLRRGVPKLRAISCQLMASGEWGMKGVEQQHVALHRRCDDTVLEQASARRPKRETAQASQLHELNDARIDAALLSGDNGLDLLHRLIELILAIHHHVVEDEHAPHFLVHLP
jgi:hypothetical protein